jgi:hypothetical protein
MGDSADQGTHDPIENLDADSARPTRGQTPPMHPIDGGAPQLLPVGRNTLGMVSLVLGVLGFACLPLVGPLGGLVCGIMGARREPRGVAIAGIVVSSLGVLAGCLLVPFVFGLVLPAMSGARLVSTEVRTKALAAEVVAMIDATSSDSAPAPQSLGEVYGTEPLPVDGWGTPLRLETRMVKDGDYGTQWNSDEPIYLIWSAGPDETWSTNDDFVAACKPWDAATKIGLPTIGW